MPDLISAQCQTLPILRIFRCSPCESTQTLSLESDQAFGPGPIADPAFNFPPRQLPQAGRLWPERVDGFYAPLFYGLANLKKVAC